MSVHRSFRLPDVLDARLVAHAAELDRSVSWVIVQALSARFDRDLPVGGLERVLRENLVGVRVEGGSVVRDSGTPLPKIARRQ